MEATVTGKPQSTQTLGTGRARGTISHVLAERGYGFIRCTQGSPDDIGQDFFFHISGLPRDVELRELLPGTLVEFTSTSVPRGKRAENVSLA